MEVPILRIPGITHKAMLLRVFTCNCEGRVLSLFDLHNLLGDLCNRAVCTICAINKAFYRGNLCIFW